VPYGLEYSFWEDFTAKIIDRIYGNDSSSATVLNKPGAAVAFQYLILIQNTREEKIFWKY
jgi:hypothetical protein